MKKESMKQQRGFTLIEMMVVVAIIGILASIVMNRMGASQTKAAGTATIAQTKQIKQALMQYKEDNGVYPATLNKLYDGTAPNGKVYTDPIKPTVGTAVTLSQKNFDPSLTTAAAAAGGGANSFVLTYTGVTGEEALAIDEAGDGSKTPTSGIVQAAAGATQGTYDVDIFVMRNATY